MPVRRRLLMACKDCSSATRKTPHPGPRCVTCHRAVVKGRRLAAAEKRTLETYNLTPAERAEILLAQGGRCAICRRATGATKRLSVDHDHACCNKPTSCGRCVRGLLCGTCNKMLGHGRDDPEFFRRAALYLERWPSGRNTAQARAA